MMKRYIMVALLAVSSGIAVGAAKSADFLSLVNQAKTGLAQAKVAAEAVDQDVFDNAVASVEEAIARLRARFVGVKGQADMSQTVKRFEKDLAALKASLEGPEEVRSRRGSVASETGEIEPGSEGHPRAIAVPLGEEGIPGDLQ